MLLFFFELSYELCVALDLSQMFLAYGGGAAGQDLDAFNGSDTAGMIWEAIEARVAARA